MIDERARGGSSDDVSFSVRLLPGAMRVAEQHRLAGQQHDNLCGAFWVATLLRTDGFAVDPGSVAVEAGTVLPEGDPKLFVPAGVTPRLDYGVPLPRTERPEVSGTAVAGLIEAVARLSEGDRVLVPLRATPWSAERVEAALGLCRDNPEWAAVTIANVRTGSLWGSSPALDVVAAWLDGRDAEAPPADWDVGHFVSIAGTVEGRVRWLVLVRDSYPSFGWGAHHVQPPERLAAALERGDGREGGIALYAAAGYATEIEQAAKGEGFDVSAWDNGTPWPPSGRRG